MAFLCVILLCVTIFIICWNVDKKWIIMLVLLLMGAMYIHFLDNDYEEKYSRSARANNIKSDCDI